MEGAESSDSTSSITTSFALFLCRCLSSISEFRIMDCSWSCSNCSTSSSGSRSSSCIIRI